MKEFPVSNCEKSFLSKCLKQNQRIDGRKLDEFRTLNINFGSDWGSAHVALGETRVLAQISCELGQANQIRPNEGMMFINVELGPMAAVHFEAGRNSDLTVRINRILERTFKDSRCVDLESLCVVADEKVWILRVDINVLNDEGNLIDCCSVAALSALAHFKRPDVTVTGDTVKIHSAAEKDFISIVLHHYPICTSYATFHEGELAVADPSLIEEAVADTSMIFGLNSYRELCCLNVGGTALTSLNLLLKCSNQAAKRAKIVVDIIKAKLAEDLEMRSTGKSVGFTECLRLNKITSLAEDRLQLRLPNFKFNDIKKETDEIIVDEAEVNSAIKLEKLENDTATLTSNQNNIKWLPESDEDDDDDDDVDDDDDDFDMDNNRTLEDDLENIPKSITNTSKPISKGAPIASCSNIKTDSSSDSEEDEKMII